MIRSILFLVENRPGDSQLRRWGFQQSNVVNTVAVRRTTWEDEDVRESFVNSANFCIRPLRDLDALPTIVGQFSQFRLRKNEPPPVEPEADP